MASGSLTWRSNTDKKAMAFAREYLRSKEPAALYGTRIGDEAAEAMHNGAGDGRGNGGPKGIGVRTAQKVRLTPQAAPSGPLSCGRAHARRPARWFQRRSRVY